MGLVIRMGRRTSSIKKDQAKSPPPLKLKRQQYDCFFNPIVYSGKYDPLNSKQFTMSDINSNYGRFVVPLIIQLLSIFLFITPLTSQAAKKMNIRGSRYCEIIFTESITQYDVYNTFGLNDCPESIWSQVNIDQVKREANSSFVHLNGPRFWVIDGFVHSNLVKANPKILGGLAMREAGVLHLSAYDLLRAKSGSHYQQWKIERQTVWIYEPGKPIYELIDPEGNVFVMQSYSIQKHSQTQDSLASLASKLTLPSGWQFKTGTLTKRETLKTINNVAIVVQDDFLNTYQKATHDFLAKNQPT